jgi:hypothetical protein
VPEVAINEHGNTPIPEYKIRTAKQILGIVLERKACAEEQARYDPLRPRTRPLILAMTALRFSADMMSPL